jgi:hypothetical protein
MIISKAEVIYFRNQKYNLRQSDGIIALNLCNIYKGIAALRQSRLSYQRLKKTGGVWLFTLIAAAYHLSFFIFSQ